MRILPLVIALVGLASPLPAFAKPKPKIAVAPITNDPGGKITQAVVDALAGKDFAVVGPKDTKRELTKSGATAGELTPKDIRKLIAKLEVVAIVDGKLGKAGNKRSLHLEVHRRGKPDDGFTIEFKSPAAPGFKHGVHDSILKRVEGAADDTDDEPKSLAAASVEDEPKRKPVVEDEPPRRKLAEDEPPRRKPVEDDAPKPKRKQMATSSFEHEDDDGAPAVRKRKGKKLADEGQPAQPLAHLGLGPSVSQRRLSWATRGGFTQLPPRVVTSSPGVRIDGEIYPFAFGDAHGGGAGFGFAASYDKSFGLKITIPGGSAAAPIDQSHYSFGARYRFTVGAASSLALGLDYFGRSYVADRGPLGGATLDTPDFKYSAVAPGLSGRTSLTPSIALYGGLDGLLMLDAGPVAFKSNYGKSTVYGVQARAGLDILLTPSIDLQLAAEYSQINLSFGNGGMMATARDNDATTQDVMGATDRSIGAAATLGVVY